MLHEIAENFLILELQNNHSLAQASTYMYIVILLHAYMQGKCAKISHMRINIFSNIHNIYSIYTYSIQIQDKILHLRII
jgi:hypothetical protein